MDQMRVASMASSHNRKLSLHVKQSAINAGALCAAMTKTFCSLNYAVYDAPFRFAENFVDPKKVLAMVETAYLAIQLTPGDDHKRFY